MLLYLVQSAKQLVRCAIVRLLALCESASIHSIVDTRVDDLVPLINPLLQRRRSKIQSRIPAHLIQPRVEELDDIIALIAHHLLLPAVPQHRHRRPAAVAAAPQIVDLLQRSAPIRAIQTSSHDILGGGGGGGGGGGFTELPEAVGAGGGDGDCDGGFEAFEGADDEGAVGPGAGEADVEVEVLAGEGGGGGVGKAEGGGGAGVAAAGVGGGELGHHEVPSGGPGGAGGGDEEVGREGLAPEETCDGGDGVGVWVWSERHLEGAAAADGGGRRREEEWGAEE